MTEWGPLDKDKLKIEVAADDPAIAHGVEDNRPITGFVWLTTGLEAFAAPLHADQEKVIQALKKLEQEDEGEDEPTASPRWIPVTERLPKPYSGEYLVTINDGSVYTDILWFDSPGDGRYESCFYKTDDDGYGVVCDNVTAWMPLPTPWKGEEDATIH